MDIAGENYEKIYIDFSNKSEEFAEVSPLGMVPVYLEKENGPMIESASILRYISDKYAIKEQGNYLYPHQPERRYRVDMMLDFNGTFLRPKLIEAIRNIVFYPLTRGTPAPNEEQKQHLMNQAFLALEKLQSHLNDKEDFIAADNLTIADIQIFFEVIAFSLTFKLYLGVKFPRLDKWLDECKSSNDKLAATYTNYLNTAANLFKKFEEN